MSDVDLMQGIQGEADIQESRIYFIFLLCILSCLSLSCVWCVQLWSDTTISQCSELRPGLDAGHRHGAEMETEFLKIRLSNAERTDSLNTINLCGLRQTLFMIAKPNIKMSETKEICLLKEEYIKE